MKNTEQAMALLGRGLLKNGVSEGAIRIAVYDGELRDMLVAIHRKGRKQARVRGTPDSTRPEPALAGEAT